uniref:Uncharacterized protein n=1 Tax=Aegilops tauschii TaxID=37682 RepID=M8BD54_AEGTA
MCCDCEHRLHAATCRFPGPTQSDIRSVDRIGRAHEYFRHFANCSDHNAVLAGDMSLDDALDGPFPIPAGSGWVDAWCELRASDVAGWTYDSVANPMLRGFKPGLTRPDRFLCKLRDFDLYSIEMIIENFHLTGMGPKGQKLVAKPCTGNFVITVTMPSC